MKILIIRPQPGNDASAQRAQDAGFDPIQLPFFEVRARDWDAPVPSQFDALLITSANAVRHAGAALDSFTALPVHAVGQNSADAAVKAGLKLSSTGKGGVADALATARASGHRRLLWLTGEDQTASEMPDDMQIETRITYASEPAALDEAASQMVSRADIVALHSARAAARFAEFAVASGLDKRGIRLAAFSAAIATAAGDGWRGVAIASRLEDQALLSAARALVKQSI